MIDRFKLVKAWNDDVSDYVIADYGYYLEGYGHVICEYHDREFKNAIEIPPALAKQLEDLGNETL